MSTLRSPSSHCVHLLSQHGAGMVEFAIVALPVLFVGLGSVELSHWFYTRQAVSLALLDAGRAAITDHNRSTRIITTFEHALRPLYATPTAAATTQGLHNALARRQNDLSSAPWQIEVLSPSAGAYTDFLDTGLRVDGATGYPAINNDYLTEQDHRHRAKGWLDGRGPVSGQTIYEANTAVLRLSWLHQPLLPLLAPILRALGNPSGNYRQRALAQGYLPMTRQIALLMQSHPVHWPDDPSGKVIYGVERSLHAPPCSGWLCNTSGGRYPDPGITPTSGFDNLVPTPSGTSTTPPTTSPGTPPAPAGVPDYSDLVVSPDDPACGVTLCCT